MVLDLLIVFPLIAFGLLGFRDGLVRKLVSMAGAILAMFIAHFFMQDIAQLLVQHLHAQPANAPMTAFFTVFFMLFALQSILYRFLTKNYKIGGIVEKIIGVVVGLAQGVLMVSIVLMILTLQGPPSRRMTRDSRLYAPVVSIAPQIKDFLSNLLPSAQESIEKMTSPEGGKVDSTLQKARE
jgi:membrane protein required for colicin V production